MEVNIDKLLIRCSSIGDLMTGTGKGWDVSKSITCQRMLVKLYREAKYNRYFEHENKYTYKGKMQEETGITLYSLENKRHYRKNTIRLTNEFLTGEVDLFLGESIHQAEETIDIKCPFSLETMPSVIDTIDADYKWQGLGYMALTGAKRHTIAYTLVNAPSRLVMAEKMKVYYDMDCPDENNAEYIAKCIEIEKNLIYDYKDFVKCNPNYDFSCPEWEYDIPRSERLFTRTIERDDAKIQQIYDKVKECRAWIKENLA
jgi:hypothetical protein